MTLIEYIIIIHILQYLMIKTATRALFKAVIPSSKRLVMPNRAMFASDPFGEKTKKTVLQKNQLKTGEYVTSNAGLHKFITRTYNTTALSIMGALGSTYASMHIPLMMMNPLATSIIGGLTMIGSFIGMQYIQPINIAEKQLGSNQTILKTQNPPSRLLLYSLGVLGLGASASPLFLQMYALNPSIIPTALGITLGIFGGASAMAYTMPKDKMLGYGRVMVGSLVGLIAMQLVGIGSAYFMGPNALSSLLFSLDNYLGILLFTGFIAYDTHMAIKQYQSGKADHLGIAVQFLLDFWNILIRVMQILSKFKE